jgi:biliverdin reductase
LSNYSIKLAIWGLGAAGKARLAAMGEIGGLELAGILSRRPEVASRSLAEVLADSSVDALAISLENTAHRDAVRRGLEAGKHVLVDYPLALSRAEGEALFRLAREKNRLLHVEHIGLLSEEHLQLKQEVKEKGPLLRGEFLFQAGYNEKIADAARSGPLPLLALPRLLQVAELWGLPEVEKQRFEKNEKGFSLHLHLRFPEGGILGFTEERREGLPRRRSLAARGKNGPIHWKTGVSGGGLFARDLKCFVARLRGEQPCYYNENLMLQLIGLLEQVK